MRLETRPDNLEWKEGRPTPLFPFQAQRSSLPPLHCWPVIRQPSGEGEASRNTLQPEAFSIILCPMLILEFPNEKHRAAHDDMVRAWRQAETPTAPGRLFAGNDFDELLSIVQRDLSASGPASVPAHLFFLADSDSSTLFGAIQIRHHIDHPNLIESGGHIGYGICPGQRRKGYATTMLALAIVEAKRIGLARLLVTCKETNWGSRKVIESNGGVFERTTIDEGQVARRYWITNNQ